MSTHTSDTTQTFEYKAEMKQLLHLIIHSLYTHPEVFLRELISNASDALNKARFLQLTDKDILDYEGPLQIKIELDKENKRFSIEDAGIGMTKEDLVDRIGTVASSGTLDFLKTVQQQDRALDGQLIGQFGVGFYSVFMVTDEITVETRHAAKDSVGLRWQSGGESTYTIEEIDKPNRGTRISFTLKDDAMEFIEEFRVKMIIKKYSNFVDFPIFVGNEQVNSVTALWHKRKDDVTTEELHEFYKFLGADTDPPLGHLHLNIEGKFNFKALLFIPDRAQALPFRDADEKSLGLYSNKILIMDSCPDLLPDYLRFLRGVVDSEDLPLNVSREVTQSSPVMIKIREVLTGRVLQLLEDWSDKEDEKFAKFWEHFGPRFKIGLNSDWQNKDRIMGLLRFETTKTESNRLASLHDYVGRMKEDQKEIYFLFGEHRELIEKNPKLEYFRKNDIEVLLLSDPVDLFTVAYLPEFEEKPLTSIEKSDLDLKAEESKETDKPQEKDKEESLLALFRQTLADNVEDVLPSKRLVDSVATLVIGKDGIDPHMERMMKMMNEEFTPGKKVLELNMAHPLVANLAAMRASGAPVDALERYILQIYEGALLIDGSLESPTDFVRRMTEIMVGATGGRG